MQKIRLFCLPYAGGSSYAFGKWNPHLHPSIDLVPIELPGRGRRINEPLISNYKEMVNDIFEAIKNELDDLPYVLFGHSMGSLLAYELVYKILESNKKMPISIIFSGAEPPKLRKQKVISTLPDEEFIEEILAIGGTPKNIFSNKELAGIFISILRYDFQLIESYIPEDYNPLDIDVVIFYGRQDDSTSFTTLQEWKNHTTRACNIIAFEGGHFFIHDNEREVVKAINRLGTSSEINTNIKGESI
ncbi:thioesterase II family protein [Bacillus thuringiensis]|uniref:Thioesterase n=1 Tax=Bacillus thuringiensis TaxID=1428 RepID=A0A9W3VIC7_BACTU|nr:alpha/beta fold hydrolase [Bacillus thuringiensis]AMR06081.1 hypothetical protein AXW78_28890 [Bacillus thuringiensis]AYF85498.1 thioesterase [Bacillus thuringiensis]PNK34681.1 thioesterase [Bacillus thuringiensis]